MRVAAEITLLKEEHRKLEKRASGRSSAVRLRERARIVLMAAAGMTNKAIASELGTDANKVRRWRSRVAQEGMSSIEQERPRGANHGDKDSHKQAELRSQGLEATTQTIPSDPTHWSCRSMARHLRTTHGFVNRVWRAHGLKPHLVRTCKRSNDPRFEEKLRDVVGLYLDPPHNAAVFSFDEKSRIQALDRTQPGLPMKQGRWETMTHDLQASRHYHIVRGVESRHRRSARQDVSQAPASGGVEVSARGGEDCLQGTGDSHRSGQLRDAQAREGACMD